MGLPRLIAVDMDGTLLRSDHTLSPFTQQVLSEVDAAGIPVVVVTGRGPRFRHRLARELPTVRYVVCLQGAGIVDQRTLELLHLHHVPAEAARMAVKLVEQAVGPVAIGVENTMEEDGAILGEPGFRWPFPDAAEPTDRESALAVDPMKIFLTKPELPDDEFYAAARRVVPPEFGTVVYGGYGLIEICPTGITKAAGLAVAAELLAVEAADVLAFGDMPNDLPMLEWSGTAVAMGNAHPELLALADAVTGTNDEDGVAVYLREHVLRPN